MPPVLSQRQLGRTLLERQMLLSQSPKSVLEASHHLLGLQAQVPNSPYLSLHARLERFEKADLTSALERREVVRVPSLRSTLHLVTSSDYLAF